MSSANDTGTDTSSGYFHTSGSSTLTDVTLTKGSVFYVETPLTLVGTLTNNGYFALAGGNYDTKQISGFTLPGNVTLQGTGEVVLLYGSSSNYSQIIPADASASPLPTLTNAAGHTIAGGGSITVNVNNQGLINANNGSLTLAGPANKNSGKMEATSQGELILRDDTAQVTLDNTGGTITTDATGRIDLINVTVKGGTLGSANDTGRDLDTGIVFNESECGLQDVTFAAGSVFVVSNPLNLVGTLTNNGFIQDGGYNFNTRQYAYLQAAADVTIDGTGIIELTTIQATNNATITFGTGGTVEGANGTIENNGTISASLVNNGTVVSTYQTMTISGPTFTNNRFLSANNNSTLSVSGGTNFTNFNSTSQTLTGGTYTVTDQGNGATLDFNGRNVLVNAATVTLSGANANFGAINGLTTNAGTLALLDLIQFSTPAALTDTGTITLDAGSTFHVGGAYTASGSKATLAVVIGGTASQGATSPGILQVNGAAALAGKLMLSFSPGATLPKATDTLTIVSATSPITGSFANVASGKRLNTSDGLGSFEVDYGAGSATPSAVVLSNFGAFVPPAPTISSFGPTSGKVGDTIVIKGTNFVAPLSVVFAGNVAAVHSVSATQINAQVPKGAITGPITIHTNGGSVSTASNFVVEAPPTISSFSPPSGKVGDTVTIKGTNFSAPLTVTFGGNKVAVHGFSSTVINAAVPSGAITGPIKVTTSYGSVSTTSNFVVEAPPTITGFSPTSGKVGATVTLTGTNFSAPLTVIFGGNKAAVHGFTATVINATVPSGALTGTIKVNTSYGSVSTASAFTVTP